MFYAFIEMFYTWQSGNPAICCRIVSGGSIYADFRGNPAMVFPDRFPDCRCRTSCRIIAGSPDRLPDSALKLCLPDFRMLFPDDFARLYE